MNSYFKIKKVLSSILFLYKNQDYLELNKQKEIKTNVTL